MNEERIKEIFANEDFVKDLFESKSYEEAQAKLADKDIDMSIDELKQTFNLIQKKVDGELSDQDLEDVAGGLCLATATLIGTIVMTVGGVGLLAALVGNQVARNRGCA